MELAALFKTLMQIGSRAYAAVKEADNCGKQEDGKAFAYRHICDRNERSDTK